MISYHFTGIIFIHGFITLISKHNKQLLDEVEHNIMNYQSRGLLSAEAEG